VWDARTKQRGTQDRVLRLSIVQRTRKKCCARTLTVNFGETVPLFPGIWWKGLELVVRTGKMLISI
jgi:hypothetical protein